MVQSGMPRSIWVAVLALGVALAGALVIRAPAPLRGAQDPAPASPIKALPPPNALKEAAALTAPPKADAQPSALEKTKADAVALSSLADQLRDELEKQNVNVYSLDVLHKTEKVERLARKIKEEVHEH